MITCAMNVKVDEQLQTVYAAIVHDIGKLQVPQNVLYGADDEEGIRLETIFKEQLAGLELLENAFFGGITIKRICQQATHAQREFETEGRLSANAKMSLGAKILMVANRYDEITAMTLQGTSESEVKAIQEFVEHPDVYDPAVVNALLKSVNVLFPGVSVILSTGERALVLSENPENILRPMVLIFGDNSILDLSLPDNADIQVVDILKTLDNRSIMEDVNLEGGLSKEAQSKERIKNTK